MKIIKQYEERIPSYALPFLINGDDSGLESGDAHNIDEWLEQYDVTGNEYMDISIIDNESEQYFTSLPAFGLPCNVMDCMVTVFEREEVEMSVNTALKHV